MIAEADKVGPAELKADGTLTYDYFLTVSKLQYKYTFKMIDEGTQTA